MNEPITQDHPSVVIMKELSDIKTNLAVNTNETANMKVSLSKIETSVNAIQADFVSRREFNDRLTVVEEQISPLRKILYATLATFGLGIVGALLKLILIP